MAGNDRRPGPRLPQPRATPCAPPILQLGRFPPAADADGHPVGAGADAAGGQQSVKLAVDRRRNVGDRLRLKSCAPR